MKYAIALISLLLISGCNTLNKDNGVELYKGFSAHQYKDIYFSGQPDLDQLDKLKERGFATIINLRTAKESNYLESNERSAIKEHKFNYSHIPVDGKSPLTDEVISKITSAIVKTRKQGLTLVHCGSGARVAMWAGGHFFKDHGYSKNDAIEFAKKLGLENPSLTQNLETYLESK